MWPWGLPQAPTRHHPRVLATCWGSSAKTRGWSISWAIDGQLRGPAAQLGAGNVSGEPFPRALFHFFFFFFFLDFSFSSPSPAALPLPRVTFSHAGGAVPFVTAGLWPAPGACS